MKNIKNIALVAVLVIAFSCQFAWAEEQNYNDSHTIVVVDHSQNPSGAAMAADLVLARPLGIASSVVGGVFYIVSLPFSALAGNSDQAAEALVYKPVRFTFNRPLGEFE